MVERGRGGGGCRAEMSDGRGARSWIFLVVRETRGKAGSGKGGLRRPNLGDMRNFWWEEGIVRWSVMAEVRSVSVEVGVKL